MVVEMSKTFLKRLEQPPSLRGSPYIKAVLLQRFSKLLVVDSFQGGAKKKDPYISSFLLGSRST